MMEPLIGARCHFSFSKYPRVLRSESQRIVGCTGKLVAQDDEWTQIEMDAVLVHCEDARIPDRLETYETLLMVKTDVVISIQRYG